MQKCQNSFADEWAFLLAQKRRLTALVGAILFRGRETGKPVVEAVNFKEIGERLGSQV
jgi:hypothetical protein